MAAESVARANRIGRVAVGNSGMIGLESSMMLAWTGYEPGNRTIGKQITATFWPSVGVKPVPFASVSLTMA